MTVVAGFEVGRYVGRAATVLAETGVEDSESAAVGAGALGMHEVEVVLGAADEAVVSANAPAASHASVVGRLHDDHLSVRTRRAEHVRLTELLHLTYTQNTNARVHVFHRKLVLVLSGVTSAPADTTMRGGRRVTWAICRWEEEILALGSNMSPGRGSIWCFLQGAEFEVTTLLTFNVA